MKTTARPQPPFLGTPRRKKGKTPVEFYLLMVVLALAVLLFLAMPFFL